MDTRPNKNRPRSWAIITFLVGCYCLPVPMPKGWHIGHRPRGPFSENLFEAMSFTGYTSSGPMRSTENDVCPSNHASTICSLPPIGWRRISQKVGAKKQMGIARRNQGEMWHMWPDLSLSLSFFLSLHIYIYIYIHRNSR